MTGTAGFRHLLVYCALTEDDAALLSFAARSAQAWDATVTLLGVVDLPADLDRVARVLKIAPPELRNRLVQGRRDRLEALKAQAMPDLDARIEIATGKPFIEVIRYCLRHDADLVVKTAERLDGLNRFLFASTDQHLLRKCPCPVWLRLPGAPGTGSTVLAAVDVDETAASEPDTLAGLNRRIVMSALRAAGPGGTAHLLHVWDMPGEGLVRLWSGADSADRVVRDYVAGVEASLRRGLERLVAEARAAEPDLVDAVRLIPRLARGSARTVIPEQVTHLGADLLVMGTIARTGVPGFIIGNTAEDILNGVDCSVMTVKPPNYISPVRLDAGS